MAALKAEPEPVLDTLSRSMTEIIRSPAFRKAMAEIGAQPVGNTRPEMAQQIEGETRKFTQLVKAADLKME